MGEREVRVVTGVDVDALRGLLARYDEEMSVDCASDTEFSLSTARELVECLPALLDELVALRAKLGAVLHNHGECGDGCQLDHDPPAGLSTPCPAGCASTMVPSYVADHLTMCPAVQAKLVEYARRLRAGARRVGDELVAQGFLYPKTCMLMADLLAEQPVKTVILL